MLESKIIIDLDPEFESYEEMEPGATYGRITIDDFYENFYMSPSYWSIADYQAQWQMAFERLKAGKDACFIVNIQPFTPLVAMWLLYNRDNKIYIQNRYLFAKYYKAAVKNQPITPENSFNLIREYRNLSKDGTPISEWILAQ